MPCLGVGCHRQNSLGIASFAMLYLYYNMITDYGRRFMYQIAICDDDVKFREEFQEQVLGVLELLGVKGKVCQWTSLEEAKCALKQKQTVELLFLDIELEKQLGMELGRFIRQELADYEMQIVYVSYESGYAMELFDTEPLGFLIKPVGKEALLEVCRRFLRKQNENKQVYYYKDGLETKVLSFRDVVYFGSMAHKIIAHTKEGNREFYGKLGELQEHTPGYFIRNHKSYLVNTHFIQSYRPDKVILWNGEELVISRSYREQVRAFVSKRLEEM